MPAGELTHRRLSWHTKAADLPRFLNQRAGCARCGVWRIEGEKARRRAEVHHDGPIQDAVLSALSRAETCQSISRCERLSIMDKELLSSLVSLNVNELWMRRNAVVRTAAAVGISPVDCDLLSDDEILDEIRTRDASLASLLDEFLASERNLRDTRIDIVESETSLGDAAAREALPGRLAERDTKRRALAAELRRRSDS